jgi:hypothetical protein
MSTFTFDILMRIFIVRPDPAKKLSGKSETLTSATN